jgi:hypothetical protein
MAYRKSPQHPFIEFDWEAVKRTMADLCDARGIKTNAQMDAAINSLTDAQLAAFTKALFKALLAIGV